MISRTAPFPRQPGTYLLVFEVDQPLELVAGRLGVCHLPAGRWVYAGSALGSGGLQGRLSRHFRQPVRQHWHIDHLTSACAPTGAFFALGETRLECVWAQVLRAAGAEALVMGFGNGDCRTAGCPAHLLHVPEGWTWQEIEALLWTTRS